MLQPIERDPTPPVPVEEDSAKRKQIIEGAREVFLAKGFDAASMNDISRVAGVSKGTLYVYFKNKEKLFEAICSEECSDQAEGVFDFSNAEGDIEDILNRAGVGFVKFLCRKEKAATVRTVIAIADRMPEVGRTFFETGPARGVGKLAAFFRAQTAAGVLNVEEPDIAAAQLIESCHATMFRPMIFNFGEAPTDERIEKCVGIAVKTFLAAYRVR